MTRSSSTIPKGRLALILIAFALAAWFVPLDRSLLRVSPAQFGCWHYGLGSQAGLYADQVDLLHYADRPLEEMVRHLTRGRLREVSGAEWERLFDEVMGAQGMDRPDLGRAIRYRAANDEEDYVNALYYLVDESPFDRLPALPEAGGYLYLRLASREEPLQVLNIPPGEVEGMLPNCRWYYDDWRIPDHFHYPARFLAPWLIGALALLLFGPALRGPVSLLLGAGADGVVNPRLRQARRALFVVFACIAGALYSVVVEPGLHTVLSGIVGLFAVITLILLWRSGLRLQRLLEGQQQRLAEWGYSPPQWSALIERLIGTMEAGSRQGLWLVGGMLLLAAILVLALVPGGAGVFTAAVLGVVLVIVTGVALFMPGARRRWLERAPRRVIISPHGILLGSEFHDFRVMGTELLGARLAEDAGGPLLLVGYAYTARHGRQEVVVAIPVPPGREEEAERVRERLERIAGGADDGAAAGGKPAP